MIWGVVFLCLFIGAVFGFGLCAVLTMNGDDDNG